MCGRYTLTLPLPFVEEHFRLQRLPREVLEQYRPRYNIAPGQPVLGIVAEGDGVRAAGWFRWGLIPPWAKDPAKGYRMINARSETAADKPAYRTAFRRRRCLLPADGFYEWRRDGSRKQPYRFRLTSRSLFAFAGLWELWRPPDGGGPIRSCTVLTVPANDVVSPVHDRMPAILSPEEQEEWLDPHCPPERLRQLLRPYPPEAMERYPVSTAVNSAAVNDPSLIEPVEGG